MDPRSSSSSSLPRPDTETLLALKLALESAPHQVKRDVRDIVRRHAETNLTTSNAEITFDVSKLTAQCVGELQQLLAKSEESKPSKKVAIAVDFTNVAPAKRTPKELEGCDILSRMSPIQLSVYKKVKEGTKTLIKHKRVYVENDYGVDDGNDLDVDAPPDDEFDEPEVEDVEVEEDLEQPPHLEDETHEGDEDELQHDHSDPRDEETTTRVADDDETFLDQDEATVLDQATEGGQDGETTAPPDEAEPTVRVYFGEMASPAQRFVHYRALMSDTMRFADCTELGITGLNH